MAALETVADVTTIRPTISEAVWELYRRLIQRTGELPTLLEWDTDLPDWQALKNEAEKADAVMRQVQRAMRKAS